MALPRNFLEHFQNQFDSTKIAIKKREATNIVSLGSILQSRTLISNMVQPADTSEKRLRMVK